MPIDVSLCHVLIDLSLRHMLTAVSLCHMVIDVSCHVSTDMLLCHWLTLVCQCWTEGDRLDNVCVLEVDKQTWYYNYVIQMHITVCV